MLDGPALDKIRRYVDNGGYLFTEDWALKEILAARFKEFVDLGPYLPGMDVNIFPKPGAAMHPYLRRIFVKPPKSMGGTMSETDFEKVAHTWKIDNESPAIKITNRDKVTILIYSSDVGEKSKAGGGSDAVAITFAVSPKPGTSSAGSDPVATGKPIEQDRAKMSGGRVLHVMSHFGKQKNQDDEFAIQNLLINFLIEANERRGIERLVEKKKP